jgi:DNA-binding MarR family transcriptional regulator
MPYPINDSHAARVDALARDLRSLAGKLKRRLREQASIGDLTPSQTAVLLRLEKEGPATTSNLARAEGMRPQSMGTLVAALEDAGLIAGAPDPNDGRQTILSLTPACRKQIEEGRVARQDWLCRTIEARFAPAEQEQLVAAFALLGRLADE